VRGVQRLRRGRAGFALGDGDDPCRYQHKHIERSRAKAAVSLPAIQARLSGVTSSTGSCAWFAVEFNFGHDSDLYHFHSK
jgi:hypothetical protein